MAYRKKCYLACQVFNHGSVVLLKQNEIADLITADTGKTTADTLGSVQRGLRK